MYIIYRICRKIRSLYYRKYLEMKGAVIQGTFTINKYSDIFMVGNASLSIGSLYMNSYSSITVRHKVIIGKDVILGENVHIYDHNHCFKAQGLAISEQGFKYKEVRIGNNCWIGTGVTILAGAEIGDNCVIGAGSIIDNKIPSNSIVVSNRTLEIKPITFDK